MYPAKILFKKKFSSSDIEVEILPNTEWQANSSYDQKVLGAWKEKERVAQEDGVRIWDGTYYRVTNIPEIETENKLILRLGTVPYRYIATQLSLKEAFKENGLEPLFHLSTASIIRTTDGSYLFGKRSRNGAIDLIGGGVQEDEIEITNGEDLERNLLKEIEEEAGLRQANIQSIEGIGIVHSITSNIIIISFVQLVLSEQEANEAFKTRTDNEMSELLYVPEAEISSFLKGMTSYRPLIVELLSR